VGVELQDGLYGRACRNIEVNGLTGRVEFLHKDLKDLPRVMPAEGFDMVVMNPPFRRPGTGKISPGDERAAARHELTAGIADIARTASIMLRNGGRFCVVYHPARLAELFSELKKRKLEPKRMRTIHSHAGDEARIVLVEAVKSGLTGFKVLPPLFIYRSLNEYTPEMREFYGLPS
ncbi:MAG TPA: SAM-dependent methyltransferase, partial [Nitrospirota bacterium]